MRLPQAGLRAWNALLAVLLALSVAAPVSATDNLWRIWDKQQVGIRDYSPCYRYLSTMTSAFKSRISEAKSKWNNVNTEFYIWFTSGTCEKDIEIKYYDLPVPFDGAWAYVANDPFGDISNSTINFNSCRDKPSGGCYSWYTGTGVPGGNQIDALSVSLHEFGHVVELTHTEDCTPSCTVMYPYLNAGRRSVSLPIMTKTA